MATLVTTASTTMATLVTTASAYVWLLQQVRQLCPPTSLRGWAGGTDRLINCTSAHPEKHFQLCLWPGPIAHVVVSVTSCYILHRRLQPYILGLSLPNLHYSYIGCSATMKLYCLCLVLELSCFVQSFHNLYAWLRVDI